VHDNLTGLPNRELFMNRLEAVISIAKTEEKVRPTVFVIDIDRFKQVNDGLGIAAGDTILLTIARRLHRLLKPQGFAVALCRRPVRADAVVGAGSVAHRRRRRRHQAGDQARRSPSPSARSS
jgi:predicted signal transduction protein with EAL and GGDEF domain